MEEYRQWLEQQIERCLNDKDLQREHWAFCKAYEKFTALRQPPVSGSLLNDCVYYNLSDRAMCPNKNVCVNCQKQ